MKREKQTDSPHDVRAGSRIRAAEQPSAPLTVLIAEDDPFVRETLVTIIGADETFQVVGQADDADTAIASALECLPDLVLMDVRMPGGGGVRATQVIADNCPEIYVVAISAHEDQATIGEMVSAGARGYITKDTAPRQMLDTLRRCADGESIFTPVSASTLMREYVKSSKHVEEAKRRRRDREERLREICEPSAITSVFQPIVHLTDGHVVMYEALTRFNTPYELSTVEWFEESVDLGMTVELEMATLARSIAAVHESDARDIVLSINVSPDTLLNPALAATVGSLGAERIVIEITEHARVTDYPHTQSAISRLRNRGARLAIDDAGAGFASLRHILDLMPDLIKLDISLVRNIDSDQPRRALATGLISFAHEINAEIIAEGIETQAELECVRGLGVQLGQGFALARPAPLPEVLDLDLSDRL